MTMSDSKDLRWIDDFGDELTMAVAMRDWEAAVGLVERCKLTLVIGAIAYADSL